MGQCKSTPYYVRPPTPPLPARTAEYIFERETADEIITRRDVQRAHLESYRLDFHEASRFGNVEIMQESLHNLLLTKRRIDALSGRLLELLERERQQQKDAPADSERPPSGA